MKDGVAEIIITGLLKDKPNGCQDFEYLVSNREGVGFQTFDVSEPGPAGYKGFALCNKVNVIHFGPAMFNTQVGINAESEMFVLKNPGMNAGWTELLVPATSMTLRSRY